MQAGRRKLRVVLLTTLAAPYRTASFAVLAARSDFDLTVGFVRSTDSRWPWGPPTDPLPFKHVYFDHSKPRMLGLLKLLRRARPQVVIVGGWDYPEYLVAFLLARLRLFRIMLWTESTDSDRRTAGHLRIAVKRLLARAADLVVVPGSKARSYVEALGAGQIVVAPNANGNPAHGPARRRSGDSPTVLFVGRLAAEKGVDTLLEAWSDIEAQIGARLVIVGSGPAAERLHQLSDQLKLQHVEWHPFLQPSEAATWYRKAQLLVLPSRSEPWGFVLNEAMEAGVPVIASEVCGAVPDLVEDGVTGWTVPPDAPSVLGERIRAAIESPADRGRIARAAGARIRRFTPDAWASVIAAAVESIAAATTATPAPAAGDASS